LKCGGSDGYSGISANPALGVAADLLVAQGGTAILSETPEIYGAEHLLYARSRTPEIAERLRARIAWWQEYLGRHGAEMDNNPSPGNKAGGITTILEKSLGAVAKSGSSPLAGVYEYAEPIAARGLVFTDSPGYDPCSVTGQIASGANVVCFTTGRGSVFGSKPVPTLKLSTNSALYTRMQDDIDVDCGTIVAGAATIEQVGEQILRELIAIASGKRSRSEDNGLGNDEFVPWILGATV
jgi:altronate hydrolase